MTVGVIDMGIDGNHPHLNVEGGMNAVWDELENDFDDNGLGHGTHVAGIDRGVRSIGRGDARAGPGRDSQELSGLSSRD